MPADVLAGMTLRASARRLNAGYDFAVPLLAGDHVTDDTGTGFVHTAPGHGREDFEIWTANARDARRRAASTPPSPTPSTRTARFTEHAPGFTGKRVINDKGEKGDANEAVIKALAEAGMLDRARAAQAPVSALLALEEAGDLPQHAAVVHRDGQADRGRRRHASRRHAARTARSSHQGRRAGCRRRARTASTA